MKRSSLIFIWTILSIGLLQAQRNCYIPTDREDYLKKSRTQKILAFGLLGAGSITWLAGASKYMNQNDNIDGGGEAAMIIGGLAAASSIPLFIIASKNKKKAMSLSLDNQPIYFRQNRSYVAVPSLLVKLHI